MQHSRGNKSVCLSTKGYKGLLEWKSYLVKSTLSALNNHTLAPLDRLESLIAPSALHELLKRINLAPFRNASQSALYAKHEAAAAQIRPLQALTTTWFTVP